MDSKSGSSDLGGYVWGLGGGGAGMSITYKFHKAIGGKYSLPVTMEQNVISPIFTS